MNCQEAKPFLFDHALENTKNPELDLHLASCSNCRAELADLQLTQKLMRQGLPEEEPPRRIAFVTDVHPNAAPARNPLRFWQWSFAGATAVAMLFAVLAIRRPDPVAPATQVSTTTFSRAEVQDIVAKAVAASEQRQAAATSAVIQSAAARMGEQLYYLQSTQSQTYKQTELNRAEIRQVANLVGGSSGSNQGVRQ